MIVALGLLACGDVAADGNDGAGAEGEGGQSSMQTGSAQGAGGSMGTMGEGAGQPDTRLYPLEVGRSWTYEVESTYPSCPAGTRTTEVTATGTVDGRSAFTVVSICGDEVAISVEGDVVESKYGDYPWLRMLDEPVEEGHTWTTTNGAATFDMSYSFVGDVTTPAGTFSDCWKVTQEVSYTQDWTYCPGVGQVRSTLVDLGGGTITYELTSKNF